MQASPGAGFASSDEDNTERGARGARRDLALRFSSTALFSASSAGSAFNVCECRAPSHSAPVAAATFSPTPTQVVPRRPSVGMSQKPAPSAPSAAPAGFDAYNDPAPEEETRASLCDATQAAAIGNVAPIAAAGI